MAALYELDERDRRILSDRREALDACDSPRVGDFVDFSDGVTRRISHIWDWHDGDPATAQTSDGGSWYLGDGFCSFSGGLFQSVPCSALQPTGTTRAGAVWFFHHDWHTAHNGVDALIPFRVYTCSLPAPR